MTSTADSLVNEARKTVPATMPIDARADADAGYAIILDVREAAELSSVGTPVGSIHVPRGLLEFKADPETDTAEEALTIAKAQGLKVHVLCASGGRAVLAAQTLNTMGYDATVVEGGMKGWKEAGLQVANSQH
ncbi:rhodanese-like domain-containing protein [Granulosicoccus sp. 3-233]|uniref:rhodanese-like domain-containing protein n=1 Tax=Granulosicoccus sp. 3-233 TaxID=3417969 RepID=UPI003D3511A9